METLHAALFTSLQARERGGEESATMRARKQRIEVLRKVAIFIGGSFDKLLRCE